MLSQHYSAKSSSQPGQLTVSNFRPAANEAVFSSGRNSGAKYPSALNYDDFLSNEQIAALFMRRAVFIG